MHAFMKSFSVLVRRCEIVTSHDLQNQHIEQISEFHQWKDFALCISARASRRRDMALSVWTALFLLLAPIAQRCAQWCWQNAFSLSLFTAKWSDLCGCGGRGARGGEGRHALHANEFQANQYPFPALLRVPPLSYLREDGRK